MARFNARIAPAVFGAGVVLFIGGVIGAAQGGDLRTWIFLPLGAVLLAYFYFVANPARNR